jgi:hypothetical protein
MVLLKDVMCQSGRDRQGLLADYRLNSEKQDLDEPPFMLCGLWPGTEQRGEGSEPSRP